METDYPNFILWMGFLMAIYVAFRFWMDGQMYPKSVRADGKCVLITGANSGIGKETAIDMADRGAKVILACRDRNRAEKTREEIIRKTGNSNVHVMLIDLASFRSIRAFAKEFLEKEPKLDILINNAGVMGMERKLTEDGLEMQMGVNYYGHFLLTLLLLERLRKSRLSRIVNVSSWGHIFQKFRRHDLNFEKSYDRFTPYLQSKLAQVMFTRELSKKLKNSGVTVYALHPGVTMSELGRNLSGFSSILSQQFVYWFSKLFFRSTKSGAQTTIYAALDFNVQNINGQYFDGFGFGNVSSEVDNEDHLKWLWKKSEEVTGITYDSLQNDDEQ